MSKKEKILDDHRADDIIINMAYFQCYAASIAIELIGKGINNEWAASKRLGADFREQSRKLKMAAGYIGMAGKVMQQFDFIYPKLHNKPEDMVYGYEETHKMANEISAIILMYLFATAGNDKQRDNLFKGLWDMMDDAPDAVKTIIRYFACQSDIEKSIYKEEK